MKKSFTCNWNTALFFSQDGKELYDRICLIIREKQGGNDTNRFDNEIVAMIDKLIEYNINTPSQDKNNI